VKRRADCRGPVRFRLLLWLVLLDLFSQEFDCLHVFHVLDGPFGLDKVVASAVCVRFDELTEKHGDFCLRQSFGD